jgi:hypothetical protein
MKGRKRRGKKVKGERGRKGLLQKGEIERYRGRTYNCIDVGN